MRLQKHTDKPLAHERRQHIHTNLLPTKEDAKRCLLLEYLRRKANYRTRLLLCRDIGGGGGAGGAA